MKRIWAFIAFVTVAASGFALPPVFVVGVKGQTSLYPSGGQATFTPGASAGAMAGYRTTLGDGYLAAAGSADIRYYGAAVSDFTDSESVQLDIGLPLGPTMATAGVGVESTIHSVGGLGSSVTPSWQLGIALEGPRRTFEPRLQYTGVYSIDQSSAADVQRHSLLVGGSYRAGLRSQLDAGLRGTVEGYAEQPVLDEAGDLTDDTRRDLIAAVEAESERVISPTSYWASSAGIAVRSSTANQAADGSVAEGVQDRIEADVTTSLTTSPSAAASAGVSAYVVPTIYLNRYVGDQRLSTVEIGGSLQGDYTFDGSLFLVGSVAGSVTRSRDDRFDDYSAAVQLGIEYRF